MIIQSTKFFHFLLRKVFETFQVYYTILHLFIAFEFMFILTYIFCLPKKPQQTIFTDGLVTSLYQY